MKKTAIIYILMAIALGACQVINPVPPTATPIPPTPTPLPLKELTICLGSEPESLYPYLATSMAARDVMQAIYDGPIDSINGNPVPVILEKIPNLADSSAYFSPVGVNAGDEVINTTGNLVSLQAGVQVFPTGCTNPTCAITWDGTTSIQMDQLTATFKLKSGLTWSDGQPLTASDSVYSFNVASDPATPTGKHSIDQTATYTATDDLTVQWVGKPGLVTGKFETYFWIPLPEHAWGKYNASELLTSEAVNHTPIGWGPYMIENWTEGESLRLVKNPSYFRAGEGLPYFDILNFKFLGSVDSQNGVQSFKDQCGIVSDSALDIASMGTIKTSLEGSGYKLISRESDRLEILAIGITPFSYDDNYYPYGGDRPDIFGDVRTRQAFATCIDRQAIANDLVKDLVGVSNSYLSSGNALLAGLALNQYSYDPTAAIALLEAAGWRDLDQNHETPRAHGGNARIAFGTPLEVSLLSSTAGLQGEIANKIAADLKACGIKVNVSQMSSDELFQPGPEGIIFGRKFDMALLPWKTGSEFKCGYFETKEIPSSANYWLGDLTGGTNFYGYSNPAYDSECERMKTTGLDSELLQLTGSGLLQILSNDLPFIPLFHFPEGYLIRDNLCIPGGSQNEASLFSAIEGINANGGC
ncbi:MAG: ABC transporter substrate-binding protein [Pelolinea sp.]|nr:ABC transporter substrate-binding protein [Pelolinea sp.]